MAFTSITLQDAAETPKAHVFQPSGYDSNGVYWLIDRTNANAVGYWRISIEIRQPRPASEGTNSKGRFYHVKVGLHEPVLETIGNSSASGVLPAPTVAYVPRSFVDYSLPERTTELDRKHLRKMTHNLQNDPNIIRIVELLTRD